MVKLTVVGPASKKAIKSLMDQKFAKLQKEVRHDVWEKGVKRGTLSRARKKAKKSLAEGKSIASKARAAKFVEKRFAGKVNLGAGAPKKKSK